jgi:ubiquinone/menaquinone biosynthesis C-methylase UbiE
MSQSGMAEGGTRDNSAHSANHYARLAKTYDLNWAYSPGLINWMNNLIVHCLKPTESSRVVDLGSGTGLYAKGLAEIAQRVVCVDPSSRMLAQLPADKRYVSVIANAEDVAAKRIKLPFDEVDCLLIKEAVHHFTDIAGTLSGLVDLLGHDGRLLIIMLPTEIEYPLFHSALELFKARQPDPQMICQLLRDMGLEVTFSYESFPLSFPRDIYLDMVRNRYMSLLDSFDDQELLAGIDEIRRSQQSDTLNFDDRFAVILATKFPQHNAVGRSNNPRMQEQSRTRRAKPNSA